MKKNLSLLFFCILTMGVFLAACQSTKTPIATLPDANTLTYEDYITMDGEEQQAFMNSFESIEAFVAWFDAAKDAYMQDMQDIRKDGT